MTIRDWPDLSLLTSLQNVEGENKVVKAVQLPPPRTYTRFVARSDAILPDS